MYELEKTILAEIEKNMPKAAGELLQKRLKEADEFQKEVSSLKEDLEKKDEVLNKVLKENREWSTLKQVLQSKESLLTEREVQLNKRDIEITARENKATVEEYKLKAIEAEKRADMVVGFTAGLVKNTEFRKSIWQGGSMQWINDPMGHGHNKFIKDGNKGETITQD